MSREGTPRGANLLGLVWMFAGRGLLTAAQVAAIMVLARLLDREEFGAAAVVLPLAQLSAWLATCGLGPALVQRPEIAPRHVTTALAVAAGGGTLLGLALTLAQAPLAWFFNMDGYADLLLWLLPLCPLASLYQVTYSLMQRNRRFRWISVTETVSYVCGYTGLSILLAWQGAGPVSLVLGQGTTFLMMLLSYAVALRPRLARDAGPKAFRELAKTGLGFGLAELVGWTTQNVDKFLVARLLGLGALGVYGRAFAVMQALTTLLTYPLDTVLFPAFSRAQHDAARLRELLLKSSLLVVLLCLPPAVLLVAAPEAVVRVLLGAEWLDAAPVLRVFGAFLLFRINYRVTDFVLRARGMVYQRLWIIVAFCAVAALLVMAGSRWGIVGVAFGMSGAFLFTFLALAWLALPGVKIAWSRYLGMFVPPVAVGALLAGGAWLAVRLWLQGWPALATAAVVGIAAFGVTTAILLRAPVLLFGRQAAPASALVADLRHVLAEKFAGMRREKRPEPSR